MWVTLNPAPANLSPQRSHQIVLGFDVGSRRIGVAVGQTVTGSASPVATFQSAGGLPDWSAIGDLIGRWQPDLLIVGMPLHADGTESDSSRMAGAFAQALRERFALQVVLQDERFSSAEARSQLKEQRQAGRRRTRKTDIDKTAAAIIVQSWLAENINHGRN
jgi:putative Holliday junction resolvase